jgi:hypothetical protein
MDKDKFLADYERMLKEKAAELEKKREEMLEKAKERGYSLIAQSSDNTWYSLHHEHRPLNLQLYVESEEFILTHMVGIIKITTDKCGSFLNDKHFSRIEKEMRRVVFNLM